MIKSTYVKILKKYYVCVCRLKNAFFPKQVNQAFALAE